MGLLWRAVLRRKERVCGELARCERNMMGFVRVLSLVFWAVVT